MNWTIERGEPAELEKSVVIGSVLSGMALFALSIIMMLMIGFLLGALVLTERIAQQCFQDEEYEMARVYTADGDAHTRAEWYEQFEEAMVIT